VGGLSRGVAAYVDRQHIASVELIVDRRTASGLGLTIRLPSVALVRAEPRGLDAHLEHSGKENGSEADTLMIG
jgi:hypothetical protein